MALLDIAPGNVVYVLVVPGAPLHRGHVLEVGELYAVCDMPSGASQTVPRYRIEYVEFGAGCCRTCGKPPRQPYRGYRLGGEIVEGCVDAIHDALDASASADEARDRAWHDRPESVRCRDFIAGRASR